MNHFCTIITANYLPYAQQLYDSLLQNFSGNVTLHTFVSDGKQKLRTLLDNELDPNIVCYDCNEIKGRLADAFFEKYASEYMDAYRWSMKTVFMKHLLKKPEIDKLIYLDCDILFVGKGDFLFDMLSEYRFLITPHWRCAVNPEADYENFQLNFTDGIYNAGFIGANEDSFEILDFWAGCCLAKCEKDRPHGFYVDQKYLDIIPSRFEGIGTVRHKGCNLAGWNHLECARSKNENGETVIAGEFEPIFVHFTPETRKKIKNGIDPILEPFFKQYSDTLKKYSDGQIDLAKVRPKPIQPGEESFVESLRRRVRIRTRLKALFKS